VPLLSLGRDLFEPSKEEKEEEAEEDEFLSK
jgi:hypothetical protein